MTRGGQLRWVVGLGLAVIATCGLGQERILRFNSQIEIASDGTMGVTETITVQAEGNRIRRGIYRDFPTIYRDRLGNRYRVDFAVEAVLRNGDSEPYRIEERSNGVTIYVGSENRFISTGVHEYQISYRTNRQLGFFEEHDELYWNVTGNGWEFVIEAASADVRLPAVVAAGRLSIEGYTGPQGSRGQDYEASVYADSRAEIRTVRALQPREGLTLVLQWPKGVISEPTALQRWVWLLRDNLGLLIAVFSGSLGLAYLVYAWHRAGRDPEPGVIFPHYEPPKNFSPASMRYIMKMGYDKRAFTAALINLAVKGFVEIIENDGEYSVKRLDKKDSSPSGRQAPTQLAAGESALLAHLFRRRHLVVFKNENHSIVGSALKAHEQSLARDYKKIYFRTNGALLTPAWIIFGVGIAVTVVVDHVSAAVGILYGVMAVALFVFAYLMKAPTATGRRLMDKVEGFKTYLEVAEKDELNLRNPPERTPELFETYLPYALALSVEQPWADKFAHVFAQIRKEGADGYHPRWYSGEWDSNNMGDFTGNMGSGLSSAISSAATPPGSSSGGGGGGSSGGGGGGGGGGGW